MMYDYLGHSSLIAMCFVVAVGIIFVVSMITRRVSKFEFAWRVNDIPLTVSVVPGNAELTDHAQDAIVYWNTALGFIMFVYTRGSSDIYLSSTPYETGSGISTDERTGNVLDAHAQIQLDERVDMLQYRIARELGRIAGLYSDEFKQSIMFSGDLSDSPEVLPKDIEILRTTYGPTKYRSKLA